MPDGILNLNKPRGPTSHDIVVHVRHLTGIRRVGHTGTLDPMATGVLVLCVGRATRVAEYLMDSNKVYLAEVRLGESTDTFDAEGTVIERRPVNVTRTQVEEALLPFRGRIQQIPPMYSAVKRKGVPLYRLARKGIQVQRPPRPVDVIDLVLRDYSPPDLTLEVVCSAGTYVRTLAHDIGQALRCGAHLTSLKRMASGDFWLADSVMLEEFASAAGDERWLDLLLPMDAAVKRFPAVELGLDAAVRLCHGQGVPIPAPSGGAALNARLTIGEPSLVRVYGPEQELLALASVDREATTLQPHKVFHTPVHSDAPGTRPS